MDNQSLKDFVAAVLPGCECAEGKQYLEATVPAGGLHKLCKALKEDPQTKMDYLFSLSGVDYRDKLGVVYHLESTQYRHIIVLRVLLSDRAKPAVDTVCDLWRTAEYHEREVYDLLGISFNNHPDLRRLFLDDSFVGHPLRKDYTDEINLIER